MIMVCRPHVNFISGSNGSGKSASLQALQCCLGVKARATGRASKVDQFIKTGCSHAIAAVSLWNTGHDAFNPTVYGSIITIERRITKASSTFILKDAAGRKVSVLVQALRSRLFLYIVCFSRGACGGHQQHLVCWWMSLFC